VSPSFDYNSAFGINLGIFSATEQEKLKDTRVTVLGLTAGGLIATMLARTGVNYFTLIDHTRYEPSDMNRDAGCYIDTIGYLKAETVKAQILRINPAAEVSTVTGKVSPEELEPYLEACDVFLAQSEDIALSVHTLILAQKKGKLAVTLMPSGLTGYVEVFPPQSRKIIDPAALFGAPENLSYRDLSIFLKSPLNRCGRRWHITEGKWRVEWFKKWRDGKEVEAQLCPSAWLGASLAGMEVIKYATGKWQKTSVPKMWHPVTADNKVRVEKYRRRSLIFERFIYWTFGIRWLGIGKKYHRFTARRLMRELDYMENQEKDGNNARLPWIWHWI
jgi:hypothetical protein